MTPPLGSELIFPETRESIDKRKAALTAFLSRGFREGSSLNALYEQVKGTTLGMRRSTFLEYAGGIYQTLEKASSVQSLMPNETFLISDLPRQESVLPDRFWVRTKINYTLPTGERDEKFLTYGFNNKQDVASLRDDITEAWLGVYIPEEIQIDSIELMEMYRQW